MIPSQTSANTTYIQTSRGPIKAIHIKVPVGIPTADGGLEIPNRVFLGGIPSETTELELETFFCDYGLVKDVRIVTDRITGDSKGYGFVTFDENEDISNLLSNDTIMMKGKKMRVRKAVRRNSSQFVNNDGKSSPESASSGSSSSNKSSGGGKSWSDSAVLFQPSRPSDELLMKNSPNEPVLLFPGNVYYGGSPYVSHQPSMAQQGGYYTPTITGPTQPTSQMMTPVTQAPATPAYINQAMNAGYPSQLMYQNPSAPSSYPPTGGYLVPVNTFYPTYPGYPMY